MENLTDWLRKKYRTRGKCPPKMDAQTAILFLEKYLLGDDWRDKTYNKKQANAATVWAILKAYSEEFQKEIENQ